MHLASRLAKYPNRHGVVLAPRLVCHRRIESRPLRNELEAALGKKSTTLQPVAQAFFALPKTFFRMLFDPESVRKNEKIGLPRAV